MEYNNIAEELSREFEQRRQHNFALFQQKQQEACEKCPGLRELIDQRHMMVVSGIRSGILHRGGTPSEDSSEQIRRLNGEIRQKLKQGGYPEDWLKPVYTCPQCKDEGFVYTPTRTMCECYRKALCQKLLALSIHPGHCFEAFNENLFSTAPAGQRGGRDFSQRQLILLNRKACEAYADSYPACRPPNLLLIGKSGLGKTFLMECIAQRVAQRGYFPTAVSAYQLFEALRKDYFDNSSVQAESLMEAELLLMDDLGTEPLLNNLTVEMLFRLLDQRERGGKHTIISTNLTENDLRLRYTERVTSRLLDPASFKVLHFIGEDIRKTMEEVLP